MTVPHTFDDLPDAAAVSTKDPARAERVQNVIVYIALVIAVLTAIRDFLVKKGVDDAGH